MNPDIQDTRKEAVALQPVVRRFARCAQCGRVLSEWWRNQWRGGVMWCAIPAGGCGLHSPWQSHAEYQAANDQAQRRRKETSE